MENLKTRHIYSSQIYNDCAQMETVKNAYMVLDGSQLNRLNRTEVCLSIDSNYFSLLLDTL